MIVGHGASNPGDRPCRSGAERERIEVRPESDVARAEEQRDRQEPPEDAAHRREAVPDLEQGDRPFVAQLLRVVREQVHSGRANTATPHGPGHYLPQRSIVTWSVAPRG